MGTDLISYFRGKADRYDEVDKQSYWRLSDALLWQHFDEACLRSLPEDFTFLDAGGGTGRWSERVLRQYAGAKGTLLDVSEDMLAVAETKRTGDLAARWDVVHGNLEELPDAVANRTFDVVFNFHNVIGFLTDPGGTLRSLAGLLRPGGRLVTLAPNLYHSVYFNIMNGRLPEAVRAVRSEVTTFTDEMPALRVFTPDQLTDIYRAAGCSVSTLTGFPLALYPSFQETQIEGSTQRLADLLEDQDAFDTIFTLESELSRRQDAAARGNNIFIVGTKG